MHPTLRTPIRPSSAYQRLPLNGAQLPELVELDTLARQLRALGIDTRPRLRRRPESAGVPPGAAALVAQSLAPERVAVWMREGR